MSEEHPQARYLAPETLLYDQAGFGRALQRAQAVMATSVPDFPAFHDSALNPIRTVTETLITLAYPDWLPVLPFLQSSRIGGLTLREYYALAAYGAALDEQQAALWHMILAHTIFTANRAGDLRSLPADSQAFLQDPNPYFAGDPSYAGDTEPLRSGRHHFTLRVDPGGDVHVDSLLHDCVVIPEWLEGNLMPPDPKPGDLDRTLRKLGLEARLKAHYRQPVHRRQLLTWTAGHLRDNAATDPADTVSKIILCEITPTFRQQLSHIDTLAADPSGKKPFARWAVRAIRYAESALLRLGAGNMPLTRDMAVQEALACGDAAASEAMRTGPNFLFRCDPPDAMAILTQVIRPHDGAFGAWVAALTPELDEPCRIQLHWDKRALHDLDAHGLEDATPI